MVGDLKDCHLIRLNCQMKGGSSPGFENAAIQEVSRRLETMDSFKLSVE